MADITNIAYRYTAADPNKWTCSLSMAWVEASVKTTIESGLTSASPVPISGSGYVVTGHVMDAQFSPLVDGGHSDSPYWNGSVSLASYDQYAYRITNISYNYTVGSPIYSYTTSVVNADISFVNGKYALAAAYSAAPALHSGDFITNVVFSLSSDVYAWGETGAKYSGSWTTSSGNPYEYQVNSISMEGPQMSVARMVDGSVKIFKPSVSTTSGRNASVSASWVPEDVCTVIKDAAASGTAIDVFGSGLMMYPSSVNKSQMAPKSTYYSVSVSGIVA